MSNRRRTITIELYVPRASAGREARLKAYGIALALLDDLFDIDGARGKAWAAQVDANFQRFLKQTVGQSGAGALRRQRLNE